MGLSTGGLIPDKILACQLLKYRQTFASAPKTLGIFGENGVRGTAARKKNPRKEVGGNRGVDEGMRRLLDR